MKRHDRAITDQWIANNLSKIQDIILAESIVVNGKIELIYQDRNYLGCDIQQRTRMRHTEGMQASEGPAPG